MIKWLLFDKDGTLIKFDETWSEISLVMIATFVETYNIKNKEKLAIELGYVDEKFQANGILASGTLSDIINKFHEYANHVNKKEIEKWTVKQSKDLISQYKPATIVVDELEMTLKKLKNEGYHLGIITSDDIDGTNRFLEDAKISYLIDEKITASINGLQKPNPKLVESFYDKWNVEPKEVIIIGDTPTDIQMGKNAKFKKTIGVLSGTGNREDLKDADFIYEDIKDFYLHKAEWRES